MIAQNRDSIEPQILEPWLGTQKEEANLELAGRPSSTLAEKRSTGENVLEKSDERSNLDSVLDEGIQHSTGLRLLAVVVSLMLAVFCVALDNTIIATAIPRITDSFSTINDIGWYGSAYLLTTCSFQLLYSKFYKFFNVKWVLLVALLIFEIGSVICGAAPTSTSFIVGRSIAGLGAAGLFTGAATAVSKVAPISLRPVIIGMLGALFGICSIIGPLLGGALTEKATWRWCFYINLPIGGVAATGILLFLRIDQQLERLKGDAFQVIKTFDPIGNLLFICSIICLLLAIHFGGTKYAYSNGRIVALFTLFGVLFCTFVAVQVWQSENATVNSRIAKQRTVRFASLFAFSIGGTIFIIIYFLPIWFQVIKGVSPLSSAIHMLPIIISQLIGTIFAGILTTKIGYYMPFVISSAVLMPIGTGLLTTFYVGIPAAKWIGYQILLGFGLGFGFQQGTVACQTVLAPEDVPSGTAVVFSIQFLSGTVFLSVAQNVFANKLRTKIMDLEIPGFNTESALQLGATELRGMIPTTYLHDVLVGYNEAITKAFAVALVMSCLGILGAAGMEWISVQKKKVVANI